MGQEQTRGTIQCLWLLCFFLSNDLAIDLHFKNVGIGTCERSNAVLSCSRNAYRFARLSLSVQNQLIDSLLILEMNGAPKCAV